MWTATKTTMLATVSDANGNVVSAVVTSGNLPAGTAINAATGEITVNNESLLVAGTYSFEVTTTDAEGGITTQTVTITFGGDTEAVYTVEPARNVDSYENNDVLATVSDADGNVVNAVVTSGNLPAGTAINAATGEITVNNESLLVDGTYSFEVTTTDAEGGITTQTVTITFGADTEAVYTVEPARNVDSYENSDVLATVSDADGNVVSAVVTSGNLPAGTAINAATGEITVNNESLLVDGTYSFEVTTTDAEGGITTQTVTITFGEDTEAVYTVEPANDEEIQDGEVLAFVVDIDGAIVKTELVEGYVLPHGMALDSVSGEITVSDRTKIKPGTYYLEVITYDLFNGNTIHKIEIVITKKYQVLEIICPSDIVAMTDSARCDAVIKITEPVVTGSGSITTESKRSDGLQINDPYPTGITTIVWTATNEKGNTAQCSQIVTVTDNELPTLIAPDDILYSGYIENQTQHVEIIVGDAIFADNCSGNLTWKMNGANSDSGNGQVGNYSFPLGNTTIVYSNTDNSGLITTDTTRIFVLPDNSMLVYTNNQLTGNVFDNEVFEQIMENLVIDTEQVTGPSNGQFIIHENGDFVYTPNQGFFGDDKVEMKICFKSKVSPVCTNYILNIRVVDNIEVYAGADTTICSSSVLKLSHATSTDNVIWTSIGDGVFDDINKLNPTYTPGISDIQTGKVILTITSVNCEECVNSKDSLILSIIKGSVVNAGPDVYSCPGVKVQITGAAAENYSQIRWTSNGSGEIMGEYSLTPVYIPGGTDEGTIRLVLTANGLAQCEGEQISDTLLIYFGERIIVDAGDEKTVFTETETMLEVTVYPEDDEYNYSWSPATLLKNPNSKTPETVGLTADTEFKVIVTNVLTGCYATDSIMVKVESNVDNLLNIRNGISPNGDGRNDKWFIEGIELFPDNEVIIFNRWGNEIFKIENYDNESNSWDGRSRNNDFVPDGTYFYVLKLNNIKTLTGWIQVRSDK